MAKSRDFIYKEVLDINGHKLGYIKDIIVDFGKKKVLGFKINSYKLLKKEYVIFIENIIYSKTKIIVKNMDEGDYLEFSYILNMHVIDKYFNVLGLVSEIIFDESTYDIKAIFIKDYSFFKGFKNRRVLLVDDLIIGEKYILYESQNKSIKMECIPSLDKSVYQKRNIYYEKD